MLLMELRKMLILRRPRERPSRRTHGADSANFFKPAALCLVVAIVAGTMAWAGHELPIYPSYYPHEIDIATVAPERALAQIERGEIQAYLGADPHPSDALPDSVGAVEALGSFVVIEVNPDSPLVRGPEGECTVA